MGSFPPKQLVIPYDDYHGKYVGRTSSGKQFFITTPFLFDMSGGSGREFVAFYLFDSTGVLIDAVIDELGTRADLIGESAAQILPGNLAQANESSQAVIDTHIKNLGEEVVYENITVQLFRLEKNGVVFGLVPDDDENYDKDMGEDEMPCVILEPGNYMAFMYPWEGEYDT